MGLIMKVYQGLMTGTLVAIKNLKFAQIQNNIYVFCKQTNFGNEDKILM